MPRSRAMSSRHLLRHQLAAEPRLRALRDVDLDAVGLPHDVDVPAEPAAEALDDDALGRLAHLGDQPAFARLSQMSESAEALASAIFVDFESAP